MKVRTAYFSILCFAALQPLPKARVGVVVTHLPVVEGMGGVANRWKVIVLPVT